MSFLLKSTFYGYTVLAVLFPPAVSLSQPSSRDVEGVSLALSLKVPPSVNGVSDFTIAGTLKNVGTRDILVVKDPNGVLYDFFTSDALDFEKTVSANAKSTKKPTFVGYTAKWDMETYLRDNSEEDTYLSDHDGVVSLTAGNKSRGWRRRGDTDDSSDDSESGPLSDTESSVEGSKYGHKNYPPGTTIDLPAGKMTTFSYKVGHAYDFRNSGAGAYTVKLKRNYFYVLVDDEIAQIEVEVKDSTPINIQGKLAADIPEPGELVLDVIESRSSDKCAPRQTSVITSGCGKTQIGIIDAAAQHADRYVAESNSYMSAMTGPTDRYEHWFGKWNIGPKAPYEWRPRNQVAAMYDSLRKRSFLKPGHADGYTYTCTCNENINAYARYRNDMQPPEVAVIHLCKGFRARNTPMQGSNSKAGTLVHEATHFTFHNPHGEDHRVFQAPCHQLAIDDPFLATTNSDNYEFFSENEPALA